MTYFSQLNKTKQKIYKNLDNPSGHGIELVYLMEMSDHYKNTVDLLKEFEYCQDNYKKFDKNKELEEKIKFLLNENAYYMEYEQWKCFNDCEDIYDIHYLKNILGLL